MREVRAAWVGMGLLTGWVAWAASAHCIQPVRVVQDLGPEVHRLEARVGSEPTDEQALVALGDHYLSAGAVGMAEAALQRAPRQLRAQPEVSDLRVRSLLALGRADVALRLQQNLLSYCDSGEGHCSRNLSARGQRRLAYLQALESAGVQNPASQPESARRALRLASRTGSLQAESR